MPAQLSATRKLKSTENHLQMENSATIKNKFIWACIDVLQAACSCQAQLAMFIAKNLVGHWIQ